LGNAAEAVGAAIEGVATLDAHRLRADFPIFEQTFHGKPLAYLDSAVSAQKPRQVLDTLRAFYATSYTNVHRGVYLLAERATERFEGARETVRAFINASSTREIVFTRSATEALNLVAYAWGLDNLGPGDLVVASELEHHSNFVPWQQIAKRAGATFRPIPVDGRGELQLDALDTLTKQGRVKVVAANLVSNALGTINPIAQLSAWAHEHDAIMVCDAAQAAPHRRIDVQALGCDFLAFSSHKLCGPTGIGVLWGRAELLERMSPFNYGGEMIRTVTIAKTTWNELPYKFEAGTPPIAEAVGMGAAIDYVSAIGIEAIEQHEHTLTADALERLAELPGLHIFGPPAERRAGIVSFDLDGIHPHDVAQILDWEGVAIRAGHHCCQPLMARLGVAATNRASFYLYTIPEEIDRLIEGLHKVKKTLGDGVHSASPSAHSRRSSPRTPRRITRNRS
jgi:cysteine desulfurase / selenocysteine lyase